MAVVTVMLHAPSLANNGARAQGAVREDGRQGGGREGRGHGAEESLAFRGFCTHRASHTMRFLLSESPSCALSRAQEAAKSILAQITLPPSLPWSASSERLLGPQRVARSARGLLISVLLLHNHCFIICIILIPSF